MPTNWLKLAQVEFQKAPVSRTDKTDATADNVSFVSGMIGHITKNENDPITPVSAGDLRSYFDDRLNIAIHIGQMPQLTQVEFQKAPVSCTDKTDATAGNVSFVSGMIRYITKNENDPITPVSVGDLRSYFNDRLDIAIRIGQMPRDKAERMAYESCVVCWLDTHLPAINSDFCTYCGKPAGIIGQDSIITGSGHWLNHACHAPWLAQRRQDAIKALVDMGITGVTTIPTPGAV